MGQSVRAVSDFAPTELLCKLIFVKDDSANENLKKTWKKAKVQSEHVTKDKKQSENVKEIEEGEGTNNNRRCHLSVIRLCQGFKTRLKIHLNFKGRKIDKNL